MPKKILLVGGGTGGHILPLKNLAQELLDKKATVHLVVADTFLDKKIIQENFNTKHLKVHYLKAHKIDYHFSLRNFVAPFKIIGSLWAARKLVKSINPDVIFFKGGFVGLPILVAVKFLISSTYWRSSNTSNSKNVENLRDKRTKSVRVQKNSSSDEEGRAISGVPKIYLHESDITSGKLTQIFTKYADRIFQNFGKNPMPLFYWPKKLPKVSQKTKPQILIFGGSQGAQFLNKIITKNGEALCKNFFITLVTGPNNSVLFENKNFEQYELLPQATLIQKILESDIVIARSGASIFQVLAARKRLICVPLPTSARNHQLHNAQYFERQGLAYTLKQNAQTNQKLIPTIKKILKDPHLSKNLKKAPITEASKDIAQAILHSS